MKESELLELAAARRYRTLREKRAEAAIKAGNWALATVSRNAARRHVAAFTDEMTALAEDGSLPQRYFIYGTEAITSIRNLAPLEGNFPADQIAEWRTFYVAQVSEALEFFQEFQSDSHEATQLLTAAAELGLIEEPVNELAKSNGYSRSSVAAAAVKSAVEIIADETPQSDDLTSDSQLLPEEVDDVPEDMAGIEDTTTINQPRTVTKPQWLGDDKAVVRPRSPFHSRGKLKVSEEEEVEVKKPTRPQTHPQTRPQKIKRGPKRARQHGAERSSPFKIREANLSPADRKKIELIRQATEAMAAIYFENMGTDPERQHRSTQLRSIFPKFTPSLIVEAGPKLGRREANPAKNFKLSEVIMFLLYGSRTTQNILQTKKYQDIIPDVIDQAIAEALKDKQEADVED